MPNYTKLFNSIVTSTIWTEDDKTRIVWITMLAISDQHGEVQASIPGLARVAGVSVQAAEIAIEKFLSPDSYSRTPDDEGRRIEKIEGGWLLLNHAKYRAMASKDDAKSANAERQKRHRERKARNASVTDSNGIVTDSNGIVTHERDIAEAEAEAKAEANLIEIHKSISCPISSDDSEILKLIWTRTPEAGKTRSSKKQLSDAWRALKKADRPTRDQIEAAMTAWNATAKWKEGYCEGIHLWVKNRKWEDLPKPEAKPSGKPQTTFLDRNPHLSHLRYEGEIPDA